MTNAEARFSPSTASPQSRNRLIDKLPSPSTVPQENATTHLTLLQYARAKPNRADNRHRPPKSTRPPMPLREIVPPPLLVVWASPDAVHLWRSVGGGGGGEETTMLGGGG
jgi:hypothetical protein